MFDIGWSELLVVLVVALVVVGPKDLPRLMRMIGRWVGKARAMADQFRKSFDELARESELDDLRAEIAALRSANPLAEVQSELNRAIVPPDAQKPAPAQSGSAAPPPHADAVAEAEAAAEAHSGEADVPSTPIPPGSDPPPP